MGNREMVERLRAQLEDARRIVREAEANYEELNDNCAEKLGEFIAANIARREAVEELELAQEVEADIQKDIDALLGE